MFSGSDVHTFAKQVMSLPAGVEPFEAFAGMIGSQEGCHTCNGGYEYFQYFLRFNGTKEQAEAIANKMYNFDDLGVKYQKLELALRDSPLYTSQNGNYMGTKGFEVLFYKLLELMGLDSSLFSLQRVNEDDNGNLNINNIVLDSSGGPKDEKCPTN